MRIALIADTFPPLRSSGAVLLGYLAREFVRQGHELAVMVPASDLERPWMLEDMEGIKLLRLRAPKTKDVNYIRRTAAEFLMPYAMLRNLRSSPLGKELWDGVVWYSPSIFFGPMVKAVKRESRCRSYLVLRDIFPQWAVDMGLMRRSLPYYFFKLVERYQYATADVIGVQTSGNLPYLSGWAEKPKRTLEVLQNWYGEAPDIGCSISIQRTLLAGRRIFVYAGNMGVAQGMDILLDLAASLVARQDIGFVFVGRGSEFDRLMGLARARGLENVLFFDEIPSEEVPGLYAQCHVGLVALDRRHKTHNIPGKFVSYMQHGLVTLASINPGNDLEALIIEEQVGQVCVDGSVRELKRLAEELVDGLATDPDAHERCRRLARRLFSPERAANQIVEALTVDGEQAIRSE